MKIPLICLSFILLILNFLDISIEEDPAYNKTELFDSSLIFLNSSKKFTRYADSCAQVKRVNPGTADYGILVASLIRRRFYHGFSVFNFRHNWLAALAQLSVGQHLASPVKSDEILKFPFAGCSQQAILLMDMMKQKKVPYRSVGFPHHYAVELSFNNKWYFFDPDMEPKIRKNERLQDRWNKSGDSLKKYYALSTAHLDWGFGKSESVKIGQVNCNPAPNASLFQSVSKFVSKTLWLLPLLIVGYPKKTIPAP